MAIVRGNSELVNRYNIATNGGFAINQRGLFLTETAAKVGDYIADAWYINTSTVDSLKAYNFNSVSQEYRYIRFTGSGKKGQYFIMSSKDFSHVTIPGCRSMTLTSAVDVIVNASIPIDINACARYHNGNFTSSYGKHAVLKANQTGTALTISTNINGVTSYNIPGYIVITLLAEGNIDFSIMNFRELPGAFINPPDFCPVHVADELARCKRYYQTGVSTLIGLPRTSSTNYILGMSCPFSVEMVGTPSVSMTAVVYEEGAVTDVSANYTKETSSVNTSGFNWDVTKVIGGSKPSLAQINWIASA